MDENTERKIKPEELNLATMAARFSDEGEAYRFLEDVLWPNGAVCPHCGVVGNARYLEPRNGGRKTRSGKISKRRVWQCREKECRKQFSVLVGTVFAESHIPLNKWVLGICEMFSDKNGVSAHELSRKLDISLEAAWFMGHRLRYAIAEDDGEPMRGIVEADETYMGGKISGKGIGRGAYEQNKTPVVTLVQRGGQIRSRAMTTVDGRNLAAALRNNVDPDAILMTDTNPGYIKAGREFRGHYSVNHNQDEYVRGRGPAAAHVNTAEGFFSQLKRSIDGTHHQVSKRHLSRYLAEHDYKRNTREMSDGERMVRAIRKAAGKRLMYDKVVNR
jgi:ISXO2-like transposase domain/Transposase zinc-ribbon domain